MIIPVKNVGKFGLVTDQPAEDIPLNAWTAIRNMRFRGGNAEKFSGHAQVFGTLLNSPDWIRPIISGGTIYWIYANSARVSATDGANHGDITRAAGDYIGNPTVGWTGTTIERIPVLNNGVDVPQMWSEVGLASKLVDLSNWPTALRANTLLGMKRYLIALDITDGGSRFPTMIKWSDRAPVGGVPLSWDDSIETNDAGEFLLPDEGGYLVDGVPLRDLMILYRESETWQMRYVGGTDVFTFNRLFPTIGQLARRCSCEFMGGRHFVWTGDDAIVHDGQNPQSIMTERNASFLRNNMDLANYFRNFVQFDFLNKEIWLCFPQPGQNFCTLAAVWNWTTDTWSSRDLPGSGYASSGIIAEIAAGETWDTAAGTWDTDSVAWKDRTSDPTKRRLLLGQTEGAMKLVIPGVTEQFAGINMKCLLEREAIGFPLDPNGPPDYTRMKQVNAIWPHIVGTRGKSIAVSLGLQDSPDDDVDWIAASTYTIGETQYCDFSGTPASRLHALRFESEDNMTWKMSGYDADVVDRGSH